MDELWTFEYRWTDVAIWQRSIQRLSLEHAAVEAGKWLFVCALNDAICQVRMVRVQ